MKVFYRSPLINAELARDGVFYAVPCKAYIDIKREKNDEDFDLIYNGVVSDPAVTRLECESEAELVVRQGEKKTAYYVKPIARRLSHKYARSYEQFAYEYENKTSDEISSVRLGQLKLYAVEQSTEVRDLTEIFKQMKDAYKHIKYICEKPKSHLKAINEVRPIETVKRIGHESIPYLAAHSEDWLARTASGLKPARLFSRVEDDDYQIYENLVTKTLIDLSVDFLRKKSKELKDGREQLSGIMNSGVQATGFGFDVTFQKAVAELVRHDEQSNRQRSKAFELINALYDSARDLLKRYRTLRDTRLYRYLKRSKHVKNPLNETNILLMDKHYNIVYKLWRPLHKEIAWQNQSDESKPNARDTFSDYLRFCKVLCGYTAHVLNFDIIEDGWYYRQSDRIKLTVSDEGGIIGVTVKDGAKRSIDLAGLEAPISDGESLGKFSVADRRLFWENDVSEDEIEGFCSILKTREKRGKEQSGDDKRKYSALKSAILQRQGQCGKPKSRKIVIIPAAVELESDTRGAFDQLMKNIAYDIAEKTEADHAIVALPLCKDDEQKVTSYAKSGNTKIKMFPLTMFDINSFRRLQNVILGQIVQLDNEHCPSCGETMRVNGNIRVCDNCRQMKLMQTVCPKCSHTYRYITYDISRETIADMREVEAQRENDIENFYKSDSLYQYKDIVKMYVDSDRIRTVCPKCGK